MAALCLPAHLRRCLEPVFEQGHIALVFAQRHVSNVADNGNAAHHKIQRNIAEQSCLQAFGCPEFVTLPDNGQREQGAEQIARHGQQPEQRIDADAPAGKGDAPGAVQ